MKKEDLLKYSYFTSIKYGGKHYLENSYGKPHYISVNDVWVEAVIITEDLLKEDIELLKYYVIPLVEFLETYKPLK